MPRAAAMTPDERRAAIVEAVVPLILDSGAMPTTREIARAAGVAEGTIFRAFEDKVALLMAVAARVMATDEELRHERPDGASLTEVLTELAEHLQGRMRRVGTVLMVLRHQLAGQSHKPLAAGPPEFVVEANQRLLDGITAVFAEYADQLAVEPRAAALALRSLVFGLHHPGLLQEPPLAPEQVAAILVHGVARPGAGDGHDGRQEAGC